MNSAELHLPAALDERHNRIVAALTRRLAETARSRQEEPSLGCAHDFLLPLLHPDLLNRPEPGLG